jgi:E3 ubiquitin-protein ligase RGLG
MGNKQGKQRKRAATTSAASSHSQPKFKAIADNYQSLGEVQQALRDAGLESSNLILGIDFTKSNTWTGKNSFNGQSLHALLPNLLNPYQDVIGIVGKTLEPFDDDKLIPAFGFGDATTTDKTVFPFFPDRPCVGFEEVLRRYGEVVPHINMSGPTSFAPLIREAINTVKASRSYHILVIIADGQVNNIKETADAIVEASSYPISIIMVGVGDGPWDTMEEFDDELPARRFDNFQFVNYNQVMHRAENREVAFSVAALQEIPEQYRAIQKLQLL